MKTQNIFYKLIDTKDLSIKESQQLLEGIVRGEFAPTHIAAILTAFRVKGETPQEIVGLIQGMRKHMLKLSGQKAVDLCGTGGDKQGTFNISTAASFVVAGAGVTVAKHGNRAASSKCGSADVLEALGVYIMLTPSQAQKVFQKTGLVFLFAPLYHPAMKILGPIRKELGFLTVFNFLGPFLNPAEVKRQVIGVPSAEIAEKLAQVASRLRYNHVLLVTSKDGLDEVSISSETILYEIKGKDITKKFLRPSDFGMRKASKQEIIGGDAKENARIIQRILFGEKGPQRNIVVLNSACALYVSGIAKTIKEGVTKAEKSIDSGSAKQILEKLIKETQKYA